MSYRREAVIVNCTLVLEPEGVNLLPSSELAQSSAYHLTDLASRRPSMDKNFTEILGQATQLDPKPLGR